MTIPVLLQSIGPCESSWVPRLDSTKVRIGGLKDEAVVVRGREREGRQEWIFAVTEDGEIEIPDDVHAVKVEHTGTSLVTAELV